MFTQENKNIHPYKDLYNNINIMGKKGVGAESGKGNTKLHNKT